MRFSVLLHLAVALTAVVLTTSSDAIEAVSRDFEGAGISAAYGAPFEPTLEAIQANVFTPSCALSFCHGAGMSAGLDLRPGNSFSSLVNAPSQELPTQDLVDPFDPDGSYLICKLEACPEMVAQQMPIIGEPLDQTVIDVIRAWILLGAPEFPPVSVEAQTWGSVKALYR